VVEPQSGDFLSAKAEVNQATRHGVVATSGGGSKIESRKQTFDLFIR
jgi:hypothetical protein